MVPGNIEVATSKVEAPMSLAAMGSAEMAAGSVAMCETATGTGSEATGWAEVAAGSEAATGKA